jgi:hypothetical protein
MSIPKFRPPPKPALTADQVGPALHRAFQTTGVGQDLIESGWRSEDFFIVVDALTEELNRELKT